MSVVNQKEYLKRYLSGGDAKKKKKKKRVTKTATGIRIVEDIVDLPHVLDRDRTDEGGQDIDELNPFMEFGEDAPQIAAIIDERPAHIRSKELFSSAKWKALGADDHEEAARAVDKSRTPERSSKPPRRHDSSDSDLSPVRRPAAADSDLSPPRADSKTSREHHRRTRHDSSDTDDDRARTASRKTDSDGDLSPPRARGKAVRKARDSDSDLSPPRTKLKLEVSITAETPRSKSSSSSSKPRPKGRVGGGSDSEESGTGSRRTLSGLKAGLGDAKAIRKEAMAVRDKENRLLERMGPQMSGKDAETVVRDRRTGRKRDLKEERRRQRAEEAKDAERQEKYMEWGRGLKQKEEREAKLDEDLYEMSKPLARYSDDVDLERHLKGQLREGDPMRDYVAKRKNKEEQRTKKVYQGPPPPPNRFDIPPGYRWDGVDRSNGFEAKYFKQQASKQAAAEEAYKWSVQDM